jgi:hypothetical protein
MIIFRVILSYPKYLNGNILKNQFPASCDLIAQNFEEIKTTLQIRVNGEDLQTL